MRWLGAVFARAESCRAKLSSAAAPLAFSQERKNVAAVVKKFNLSQKFVDTSYGIFQQLDLDKNGAIDLT